MRKRLFTFCCLVPVLSVGVIHCVGDDPATGSPASDDGGNNGGDSTTSGGDGSTSGDGSTTKTDGSTPPNDACIGNVNCPTAIDAAANLKLWLRGNVGVTCSGGRVSQWVDQSLAGNNGVAANFGGPKNITALTPQCGKNEIAGHNVVTFTAPIQDAGAGGPFLDETLRTDTDWIFNTEYTFFVVHRRQVDGTFGLIAQDVGIPGVWNCTLTPGGYAQPQDVFAFGFRPLASTTSNALYYAQHCLSAGAIEFGPSGESDAGTFASGKIEVDEVVFSIALGHQIYVNGVPQLAAESSANDKRSLTPIGGGDAGLPGFVGRASDSTVDNRYQGDIAEVIGYKSALGDSERAQIEAYLKLQWGLTF
jgi:hypothetical protein